jgi:hypothetical protein
MMSMRGILALEDDGASENDSEQQKLSIADIVVLWSPEIAEQGLQNLMPRLLFDISKSCPSPPEPERRHFLVAYNTYRTGPSSVLVAPYERDVSLSLNLSRNQF